jgi:hypothetical protein
MLRFLRTRPGELLQEVAVAAAIDHKSFITPGEQMAAGLVVDVEAFGIDTQDSFHSGDQIRRRRFDDEMEMISHQAPCMELPVGFGAGFVPRIQKTQPTVVIFEDSGALIAAIHDVINRTPPFDTQMAEHGRKCR